jgi:hypothetical protein
MNRMDAAVTACLRALAMLFEPLVTLWVPWESAGSEAFIECALPPSNLAHVDTPLSPLPTMN